MKSSHLFIVIFTVLLVTSCGGKKKTIAQKETRETSTRVTGHQRSQAPARGATQRYSDVIEEYIAQYSPIAMEEMRLYNIPASITLAQGILESGAGRGELTRRANNHFGIKCHNWTGEKVYHDDDRSQECFRKYKDPKYSYRDHSLFLAERKRYAGLFELDIDDYKGWAKGLRAAGYATDRLYPTKLIDLIERYDLQSFDAEVLGRGAPRRAPIAQSDGGVHYVQKGDTLYSIAKRYNTTVEVLQKNNNIRGSNISIGQQLRINP